MRGRGLWGGVRGRGYRRERLGWRQHVSSVLQVVGVVKITTLTNRQYCVIMDPAGADGKPQLGQKKLVKGEKSFFLLPGESLEKGIQNVYVLGEDEGLILKASEGFKDTDAVSVCGLPLLSDHQLSSFSHSTEHRQVAWRQVDDPWTD